MKPFANGTSRADELPRSRLELVLHSISQLNPAISRPTFADSEKNPEMLKPFGDFELQLKLLKFNFSKS